MSTGDWLFENREAIRVLKARLGDRESCSDMIVGFEELLRSICAFTARLIGPMGTKAVLARSIKVAARDTPLVEKVRAAEGGADFSEFRDHVEKVGCSGPEVMNALLRLNVMIFTTLRDLTGEALTESLLQHLEEEKK